MSILVDMSVVEKTLILFSLLIQVGKNGHVSSTKDYGECM
jgi:hypothetical protein